MHRDQLTKKIARMIGTIEAESLPIKVRELYVFGSYSRGAIEPGDLDLILVHDPPSQEYNKKCLDELRADGISILDFRRIQSRMEAKLLAPLRKPGERVQIIRTQEIDQVTSEGSKIKREDAILIWSRVDRNWRAKLDAIKPDETEGRAPRNHIVPLTRVAATVGEMEAVVSMVENERLKLTRIAVDSISLDLDADHRRWLEHWTKCNVMGKKSMETLPYVMWWFQQHRKRCDVPNRTEVMCREKTYRVEVGRPSLRWIVWRFKESGRIKAQCLIPHFMKTQSNELLVFERGPKWNQFKKGDPEYDYFGWQFCG